MGSRRKNKGIFRGMNQIEMLLAALLLDAALGDPARIWSRVPHPVALAGRAIGWGDARFNRGANRALKGRVLVLVLSFLAAVLGFVIALVPDWGVLEVLAAAILLAHGNLMRRLSSVRRALAESVATARIRVASVTGQDVSTLDESGVARATIEAGAEGFLDDLVAPAFWFLVLGLPGLAVFKMVQTADSLIGHVDERHVEFGRSALRLKHWLTWIPARIAGGLLVIAAMRQSAGDVMLSDASLHVTPNTGFPEAAIAGGLKIALSGPRIYDGEVTDDPWINGRARRVLTAHDLKRAIRLIWRAWAVLVLMLGGVAYVAWEWTATAPVPAG
jgi:adenosylcobinamide-phosphate synthase